jgi:threonine/homoserine/homoserine lactone efflux protein
MAEKQWFGLAAAAPRGPVNMLAIRRGMIGGWRRTLAYAIGSVAGDVILFSMFLLGGHCLLSHLSNPTLRTALAAIGVIVLLPLGIYFLVPAVKEPVQANASNRAVSADTWPVSNPAAKTSSVGISSLTRLHIRKSPHDRLLRNPFNKARKIPAAEASSKAR